MTQRIINGPDQGPRKQEWEILSSFFEDGYELIAPNGQRCGRFPTMRAALAEKTRLCEESLKHQGPFEVKSAWKTPVLLVAPGTRVVEVDSIEPGQMFLIDGETFCVNGEYPYAESPAEVVEELKTEEGWVRCPCGGADRGLSSAHYIGCPRSRI